MWPASATDWALAAASGLSAAEEARLMQRDYSRQQRCSILSEAWNPPSNLAVDLKANAPIPGGTP
jgi:hypothetical protein